MLYNVEDIFEDIPGDDNYCIMKLPPEIISALNLSEGDKVIITVENDTIYIKKG